MKIQSTQIKLIFCFLFSISTLLHAQNNLDRFAGSKDLHFSALNNDFFCTEYHDGKWWLVTPQQNAFISIGLNHFYSGLFAMDYNKGYWENKFGGPAWSVKWKDEFYKYVYQVSDMVGANTLPYHSEDAIILNNPRLLPYIRQYIPVKFSFHLKASPEAYIDIFAPRFADICSAAAKEQVQPYINDTMIIGFAMADIPVLTEGWAKNAKENQGYDAPTWPGVLRNLPGTSSGKQKYVETMRSIYNEDIDKFNQTYATGFISWLELTNAENWRPKTDFSNAKEMQDNNMFGKLCIDRYYQVASEAFRAVDKNHLFLGDKLQANLYDLSELDLMVNVVKKYTDVILIQCFAKADFQKTVYNRISSGVDLPIINGDLGVGALGNPKMPNPQYPVAASQAQRAVWLSECAEVALKNPNVAGWHICGVIDGWNIIGTQKPGIMNPLGEFHTAVVDTLRSISNKLYKYKGVTSASSYIKKFDNVNLPVKILANPASDYLLLSHAESVDRISFFNSLGSLVLSKPFESEGIRLSEFVNGLYFVVLEMYDGNILCEKLIIQNNNM